MRVGKRPAVPAFSLIITENSDKEVEWQNKQNVITYRNKMYNIMHKRKLHNISLKYKKSFKINKNNSVSDIVMLYKIIHRKTKQRRLTVTEICLCFFLLS